MKDSRFPSCPHAVETERASVVECGLGFHGGRPHVGVCVDCEGKDIPKPSLQQKPESNNVNIEYQEQVLKRMETRGVKSCEIKRQRLYIKKLKLIKASRGE